MPALALALLLAAAPASAPPAGWRLERAAVLMRHGVRPPTKAVPLPAELVSDPWPAWPVPPGELTPHGAQAVRKVAAADRSRYAAAGLAPRSGCPAEGALAISADSDQRTIATAEAWAAGFAPGCSLPIAHRPQGEDDPVFQPIASGAVSYDPAAARAAVLAAGSPAVRARAAAPLLRRLDAILSPGCARAACRLSARPTALAPAEPRAKPKLTGGLDVGSTAAQVLLLEHADGRPAAEVGWGRATAADITRLSALHALEFELLARPRYVAARNLALLGPRLLEGLFGPGPARLTLIVGHDTNVASLGGLLDLHWRTSGFAPDDPPPGGALGFELWRDGAGRRFVRAVWRAQSLAGIRAGDGSGVLDAELPIPGCRAPCPAGQFERLVRGRLAPVVER